MTKTLFHELRDTEWLRENVGRSYHSIAEELGCPYRYVVSQFRIYKRSIQHQNQIQLSGWQEELVKALPDLPRAWICERMGISEGERVKDSKQYWSVWQKAVLKLLPEWYNNLEANEWGSVLDMEWRPIIYRSRGCGNKNGPSRCPHYDKCKSSPLPPLCERTTVGDVWMLSTNY